MSSTLSHPQHFAYQSKKSAELTLRNLIFEIEKPLEQSEQPLGGLIDIDGASNNIIF